MHRNSNDICYLEASWVEQINGLQKSLGFVQSMRSLNLDPFQTSYMSIGSALLQLDFFAQAQLADGTTHAYVRPSNVTNKRWSGISANNGRFHRNRIPSIPKKLLLISIKQFRDFWTRSMPSFPLKKTKTKLNQEAAADLNIHLGTVDGRPFKANCKHPADIVSVPPTV